MPQPEGHYTVQGSSMLPGDPRLQHGRKIDGNLENQRGTEKLSPDDLRKLYEQRAKNVAPEYRPQVEAFFRAISDLTPTTAPATAPSK